MLAGACWRRGEGVGIDEFVVLGAFLLDIVGLFMVDEISGGRRKGSMAALVFFPSSCCTDDTEVSLFFLFLFFVVGGTGGERGINRSHN